MTKAEAFFDAYQGIALQLIETRGKCPLREDWQDEPDRRRARGTTEEDVCELLADWYRPDGVRNVGLVIPSQVIVLDIDQAVERALEVIGERAPVEGPLARTPRGGAHVWFRGPKEIGNRARFELEPGLVVDIRANGKGQCVVWPSLGPDGGRYVWENALPFRREDLPLLPAVWIERLRPRSLLGDRSSSLTASTEGGPIAEGARNTELFRRACRLQRQGLSDAAIFAAIQAENRVQCRPGPLPDREVEMLIASALRYPKGAAA